MTTKLDMLAKLQEQKCLDNANLLEDKKETATIWFASLRDEICKSFEKIEKLIKKKTKNKKKKIKKLTKFKKSNKEKEEVVE